MSKREASSDEVSPSKKMKASDAPRPMVWAAERRDAVPLSVHLVTVGTIIGPQTQYLRGPSGMTTYTVSEFLQNWKPTLKIVLKNPEKPVAVVSRAKLGNMTLMDVWSPTGTYVLRAKEFFLVEYLPFSAYLKPRYNSLVEGTVKLYNESEPPFECIVARQNIYRYSEVLELRLQHTFGKDTPDSLLMELSDANLGTFVAYIKLRWLGALSQSSSIDELLELIQHFIGYSDTWAVQYLDFYLALWIYMLDLDIDSLRQILLLTHLHKMARSFLAILRRIDKDALVPIVEGIEHVEARSEILLNLLRMDKVQPYTTTSVDVQT